MNITALDHPDILTDFHEVIVRLFARGEVPADLLVRLLRAEVQLRGKPFDRLLATLLDRLLAVSREARSPDPACLTSDERQAIQHLPPLRRAGQ